VGNIERSAAKVLLVTPQLDVLLFSSLDPGDPSRPRYWFATGGGVESGETLQEAAIREVFEETGLELPDVGSPLFTRHATFDFEDDHYEQEETYFARTDATVYPEHLAELLWSLRDGHQVSVLRTARLENADHDRSPNTYSVRPATSADGPSIQLIERRAAERFREVGLPEVADDEPESIATLDRLADDGRSFVAIDASGDLVGYVLVEQIDAAAFVHQVSVLPEHQGRGIGRRLLDTVDEWAREQNLVSTTLTTFDDHVPWNRPLYEHLGFRVMKPDEMGKDLQTVRAAEAARGLQRRVAMIRSVLPMDS
jgi:8-oxo-dGTP pyrophosphatase MutT (NUDIX family)/predicted GNAT family acetyltransferase